MTTIVCCTLGPVAVTVNGGSAPPELLWRKHLALLIYLARSPGRVRSRDHLLGLLWAEKPDAAARHSLREAVRVLRRCVGEAALEATSRQVRLVGDVVRLDTEDFEACVGREDWGGAASLVAGEYLEGFGVPGASAFEDWLTAERLAWRRRSVEVLVRHAEELLRRGETTVAAAVAERAMAVDPLSDVAVQLAMKLAALNGYRGAALECYEALVARLRDAGLEPEAETVALADRIRAARMPRPTPVAVGERDATESRRPPLVGRAAELGQLVELWESVRARSGAALALIGAEPGLGKTRLLDELAGRARLDGAAVSVVRAVEADYGEPWSGVLGLARGGLVDARGVGAAAPEDLAAFCARFPQWADRFPGAAKASPEALSRALRGVLGAVVEEQPTLLGVDDAQWLDRDSLLAVDGVLRDLSRAPMLVVLAATPHPPRVELDALRSRLGRDLRGAAVSLEPLPVVELRRLAEWSLPDYDQAQLDRVTRRVAVDSAGLPLLAVDLFHAIALGLEFKGPGARAWPEPLRTLDQTLPGDLPDAVVGAIRVGYRRLSAAAQQVLAASAVAGDRESPERLARATGLEVEAVMTALDELEWGRWLTAEPRGYAFVARIVREVIARDMLTEGQRQRIRERIADS